MELTTPFSKMTDLPTSRYVQVSRLTPDSIVSELVSVGAPRRARTWSGVMFSLTPAPGAVASEAACAPVVSALRDELAAAALRARSSGVEADPSSLCVWRRFFELLRYSHAPT